MRGFRSVILDGHGLAAVVLPVAVLAAMSGAFATIALARFRFGDAKVSF